MNINEKNILKYLIIIVVISTILCFAIKLLAYKNIIPWTIGYSDVMPFSERAFEQGMPYIDKLVEYPLIIGLLTHIASRFSESFYLYLHFMIFLVCAIISTIYLCKLSDRLKTNKKYLFIFWALAPSLLWFVYYNWDIIAVMFSVMALYYFKGNKNILATVLLALGFSTKMFPILFLLPILINKKFVDWIKLGFTFILTFFVLNIFFIIKNFHTWFFAYGIHGVRPPNLDSIWHIIMQIFPFLTVNSVNILAMLIFIVAYLFINIKLKNKDFIFISFLSVLLFLITNKVFSPQYTLWLLPFFALYGAKLLDFYSLEISNLLVLFTTLGHIFSGQTLFLSGIFVILRHAMLVFLLLKNYYKL